MLFQHCEHVAIEAQQEEVLAAPFDRRPHVVAKLKRSARRGPMAGPNQRQREIRLQYTLDQRLDPAAAGLVTEQACLDDAGVVEHEQVARSEQPLDVCKDEIAQAVGRDMQQPARTALGQRLLRNQLVGEFVVEVVERQLAVDDGLTGHTTFRRAKRALQLSARARPAARRARA